MRIGKFKTKIDINLCCHNLGNGGSWYKCELSGKNCPYQHWCTQQHIFLIDNLATKCSNYKKEIK